MECSMNSYIKTEALIDLDPDIKKIIELEEERQNRKLIMIPSESSAPSAIRESLGSVLQNIYAEGYPSEKTRSFSEKEILDVKFQLINFRRYSDPRYYKGVEFIDILEEIARKRCANLFSNNVCPSDDIFVNVQPLSGAPANNAVYQALLDPGDSILGMNLFHGGHLTHGSSVNRSGRLYKAFHYGISPVTEKIDYEQLQTLAKEINPKIIIAGYSSYPWVPDWQKFKEIAENVGAYLFADISHIAGMVAASVIPSPVGYADIITFTTHKTLCGPRGACILSFDEKISSKIDRSVFPGEQGGPHAQIFAAMATTFKLAQTQEFRTFQNQIIKNCKSLTKELQKRKIRIAYGGTDTHLTNIDCKSIKNEDEIPLTGDMAARILDLSGIVVNANTIPGDKSTFQASGIRLGTPWVTQRGLMEDDMEELANIIADIITSIKPYTISTRKFSNYRAKIDFLSLEKSKIRVRNLSEKALKSVGYKNNGYPYFYFLDDFTNFKNEQWISFQIKGEGIQQILNYVIVDDIEDLIQDTSLKTSLFVDNKKIPCLIKITDKNDIILSFRKDDAGVSSAWLRDLSDGFIQFDRDLQMRIPGPFLIERIEEESYSKNKAVDQNNRKPYYIGIFPTDKPELPKLQEFNFSPFEKEDGKKRTRLFDWHQENRGRIIPFAGWEMPVWYTSVVEEHKATRNFAGLFDVSHMGVFQAQGPSALSFLDSVCANDISTLKVGQSCYTHFLSPDADVIDDLLVYHHRPDEYLIVVNAANDAKDWAWLNAVKSGNVLIDKDFPFARCYGRNVILRNLRDASEKSSMRVDIALQGPLSRKILLGLQFNSNDKAKISSLSRTELCHVNWRDLDLIISRTGYTGERIAFEIFIHPDATLDLWKELISVGKPLGLKPCGLGARDSLRTEAGLPLYGHEMGGVYNLGIADAGFIDYIKVYKPWFIGRSEFIKRESQRNSIVARFRFIQQRVRMAHLGDPILNSKGKVIGFVTSCAIDEEEFLTGQAYIDNQYAVEGTEIYIYQGASELMLQNINQLRIGDRTVLPDKAQIINRFAKL